MMTPNFKKALSIKIKALRKINNLTQEELAEKCSVSWRTISNLERGTVLPGLDLVCNLSKELNVSIDELLNNSIEKNKSFSRLSKESALIEEITQMSDNTLDHLAEYVKLLKKY